jgi:hypothetical protein
MGHTGEHERGGRAGERVAASGGKQRVQMTIAHSPTTSTSLSTRVARWWRRRRRWRVAGRRRLLPPPPPAPAARAGRGVLGGCERLRKTDVPIWDIRLCYRHPHRLRARRGARGARAAAAAAAAMRAAAAAARLVQPAAYRTAVRPSSPKPGRPESGGGIAASVCACTCVGPTALVVYTGSFVHTS